MSGGYAVGDYVLCPVGVLVFVDENVAIAIGQLLTDVWAITEHKGHAKQ